MARKVSVGAVRGLLRLSWTYGGKQNHLYLGMPDTPMNRQIAEARAQGIWLDIVSGNFDTTLNKYKPEKVARQAELLTFTEVFRKFSAERKKSVDARTYKRYRTILGQIDEAVGDAKITARDAETLYDYLRTLPIADSTIREKIQLINASLEWAIDAKLLTENPFAGFTKRIRVTTDQIADPFTEEEMQAIIKGFKDSEHYSHYYPMVCFMFGSGARTGEVYGLRWGDLTPDCSIVTISGAITKGVRKPTKTNRVGQFALDRGLVDMLQALKKERNPAPSDPVFPSPTGLPVDDHNFCQRAWKKVLAAVGVRYRRPYTTRHTYISIALSRGVNLSDVAQVTRHREDVMLRHYRGYVKGTPTTISIFERSPNPSSQE